MRKAFLLLCIVVGVYELYGRWEARKARQDYVAFEGSLPRNRAASQAGFVDAIEPDGIDPRVITVFMPVNCPLEAGRRGRALVERIKAAGIPVTASSSSRVSVNARTKAEFDAKMALANRVMGGETPIVFYRGRAKNNPSFDEVLLEYQSSR